MMSTLPPEWITNCTFSLEIGEQSYEFSLQVNLYGEVLAIDNHFLQLPPMARYLMTGSKTDAVADLLEKWKALFHFYVPLAALGYMEGGEWSRLSESIRQFQANIDPLEKPGYAKVVRNEWVRKIYALQAEGHGKEVLSLLADLLLKKDELERYQLLGKLKTADNSLVEPVLHALLPTQDNSFFVNRLYEAIASFKTEAAMQLLLGHLQDKQLSGHHSGILFGLAAFEDPQLQEQMLDPLLAYLRNAPIAITDRDYATLLRRIFGNFPRPDVSDFLLKILGGFRVESAQAAFDILRGFGKEERMLSRALRHIFSHPRPPLEYIKSAIKVFGKMEDQGALPYSDELLDLFVWNCQEQFDVNLIHGIDLVLKRKLGDNFYSRLSPYLQHHEVKVQQGARLFFSKDGKVEFGEFQLQLKSEDPAVKKMALNNIQHLATGFEAPQLIRPLLKMKEAEADLEEHILLALSTIVKKTPEKVALSALVSGVKHANPRVRAAIADSLTVYLKGHPQALSAIEALWNDPDEKVKIIAREAYHSGLRTRRKTMRIKRK